MKILPGMMLTLPTVIAMVLVPLRSARHLIAEQKNQRLKAIDEAISKLTNPQSITDMQTLNTLLTQRGHLQKDLQLAVEPGQPRAPAVLSDHSTPDLGRRCAD